MLGRLYRDIPLEDVEKPKKRSKRAEKGYYAVLDEGSVLMRKVGKLVARSGLAAGVSEMESEQMDQFMLGRLSYFGAELLQIARSNTLNQRSSRHLTEEEVFCGTISAIGDARRKREATVRLKAQSQLAFSQLRYEIEDPTEALTLIRAWRGFLVAKGADQSVLGVKSFGWTCLGLVLGELLIEEDEED